jgi:hypothetical protein
MPLLLTAILLMWDPRASLVVLIWLVEVVLVGGAPPRII